MAQIDPKIISIAELLQLPNLTIPPYQRPYKWTVKHVGQLFKDITQFKGKKAYRLGTIVLHVEKKEDVEYLNIVDGQQRTITLMLIACAMAIRDSKFSIEKYDYKLPNWEFNSQISHKNLHANYTEITQRIKDWDEDTMSFLLHNCEVVVLVLTDISEAFQFFDSQNSRGKSLEPHDLLKAYHLREMSQQGLTEQAVSIYVDEWEKMETNELASLFNNYLYKIRAWSKENWAGEFTKEQIVFFKGINTTSQDIFPFEMIHKFADRQVSSQKNSPYPFQLDQPLINGFRFFEFVSHYRALIGKVKRGIFANGELPEIVTEIFQTINDYEGCYRRGDVYVRELFYCCVTYYIDKFGFYEFPTAVKKIFVWAYSIRITSYAVHVSSINNAVLHTDPYIFWRIREANHPTEFLEIEIPKMKKMNSTKTEKILELFQKIGY